MTTSRDPNAPGGVDAARDDATAADARRPLWRMPVMWLVVGLPLTSIVAGVGLVVVATRSGNQDVSVDRVQRTAQIQVADLGPDDIARRGDMSGIVRLEPGRVEVLPVSGTFDRDRPLQLRLLHPSDAARDTTVLLAPSANGWSGRHDLEPGNDWNLQLGPQDGRWRLQGRLGAGLQAAHLRPALQSD